MAGFWLPGWPLLNPGLGRNVCGQEQRPENAFLYIAGPGETSTCFWVTWFYEGGRPRAHRNELVLEQLGKGCGVILL